MDGGAVGPWAQTNKIKSVSPLLTSARTLWSENHSWLSLKALQVWQMFPDCKYFKDHFTGQTFYHRQFINCDSTSGGSYPMRGISEHMPSSDRSEHYTVITLLKFVNLSLGWISEQSTGHSHRSLIPVKKHLCYVIIVTNKVKSMKQHFFLLTLTMLALTQTMFYAQPNQLLQ